MASHKLSIYTLAALLPIALSISCHGETGADGIVYDAVTGIPMDSVVYERLGSKPLIKYTDSTGAYSMYGLSGGCMPDCPDLNMQFSKSGYKSQRYRNPDKKDIYLEKEDE